MTTKLCSKHTAQNLHTQGKVLHDRLGWYFGLGGMSFVYSKSLKAVSVELMAAYAISKQSRAEL
jgi:hypothetical protein